MKKAIGILIILLITVSFSGHTQQATITPDIGVFFQVECSDANMKILIERYIGKELKNVEGIRMGLASLEEVLIAPKTCL